MSSRPDLPALLAGSGNSTHDGVTLTLRAEPVGELVMPSGELVAGDPFMLDYADGFTVTVPPGSYPVRATVADLVNQRGPQSRTAALCLLVRAEEVTSWEPATWADDTDPDSDGAGSFLVDAGSGCLLDRVAAEHYLDVGYDAFDEVLSNPRQEPVPGLVVTPIEPESGANLVAVESGWGDGRYRTWIGRTAAGEVAAFVTDFGIWPVPDRN
ncbi:DUF4241 domain-containing protein [Longispora sp. NPDC051575]|uniref:DUF4241 domain-containing protein n=1 Tax=Longispora sp. NPDC051575 TaxID=3154943 RepID=UPI00341D96A4